MNATETTATVRRYNDGAELGIALLSASDWAQYEAGTHPGYQWPEGIARAGDVLPAKAVAQLGIDDGTTIFLE